MSRAIEVPSLPLGLLFAAVTGDEPKVGLTFESIPPTQGRPACVRVTVAAGPSSDRKAVAFVLPDELAEDTARQLNKRVRAGREGKTTSITCAIPLWDPAQHPAARELVRVDTLPAPEDPSTAPTEAPPPTDAETLVELSTMIRARFGERLAGYVIAIGDTSGETHFLSSSPPEDQAANLRGMADAIEVQRALPRPLRVIQ